MSEGKRFIVGIDPSGSFNEGKGTTGFCFIAVREKHVYNSPAIYAKQFKTAEEYWQAHITLLNQQYKRTNGNLVLSIEDYVLYGNKAKSQTNSSMETSQLIGIIKMWAHTNGVPYTIRNASIAKKRWTNEILEHKGFIKKVGRQYYNHVGQPLVSHTLDAMRHAVHCLYFENKKEKWK